jgi:NAD(P)-dependent dehydrogenase (short-subunit alcohol dehydrogenase family)
MPARTWLITGVSSGFGRELTTQLLERGDRVVGTARRLDAASDLTERYPDAFRAELLELTDTTAIRDVIDRSFTNLGRIDVIVSNAGYGLFGAAEELSDEQVEHIIATNLTGSINLIRAALPICAPKAADASSSCPPTEAKSRSPATRSTTQPNGASRASSKRSHKR